MLDRPGDADPPRMWMGGERAVVMARALAQPIARGVEAEQRRENDVGAHLDRVVGGLYPLYREPSRHAAPMALAKAQPQAPDTGAAA